MRPKFTLIGAFFILTSSVFSQQPPIEPGVSQTLAQWRAAHYSDVRYKLNLSLEKMSPLMKGEIEIAVTLDEEGAKNDLILDWRTTAYENDKDKPYARVLTLNNRSEDIRYGIGGEHLFIRDRLKVGENIIKIQFASPIKTSGSAITRYLDKEDGSEYIYSLFVPNDASTAFPVFDQPDLKARFTLVVGAPSSWTVVSNTPLTSQKKTELRRLFANEVVGPINDPSVIEGQYLLEFEETQPISTYVFAFAAGNFASVQRTYPNEYFGRGGGINAEDLKLLREEPRGLIYVRRSQFEKFKPHVKEVFRLNREAVKYLEGYFDYKFPFPKYDLVLIPEFPFGGMEHAGATFLRESSIIFPSEPTKNDIISRANLIFHEAAHQWFGDTITMKWFDDLWLKEGFAEFMAYKTLEKVMPEANAWKAFYERNKQLAYLTDSTKGTTPIYRELSNLSSAKSAYGNIVYRKAPSFLRQAEFYLGEKDFQTAIRVFLKNREFANGKWSDLVGEFRNVTLANLRRNNPNLSASETKRYEETVSKRINEWTNVWVTESGVPIVNDDFWVGRPSLNPVFSVNNSAQIRFREKRHVLAKRELVVLFNMLVGYKDERIVQKVSIPAKDPIDLLAPQEFFTRPFRLGEFMLPDFVFPNYQDYGYGIFLLDDRSRKYILANVQNEKDDFLRSMMYGSLWDSVREAELDPKDYVELVIKNVGTEKDEAIVSSILSRSTTALNYYITTAPTVDADNSGLGSKFESVLLERMQNSQTLGQRITFYRAFLNVVSSENGKKILKQLLNGDFRVNNIPIKTKDKFDIVTRLFILNDKDAVSLFNELIKTETSDDAKRYAYVARAGTDSAENKAKFFSDFVSNKEVSESWIEAAFVPFNSIKHSQLTLPYLKKSLDELPNLKRNRKIFFVNGWLSAFIGGQKTEEALKTANDFLEQNPQLDNDLRLKILENIDNIERSIKIRSKFSRN